jgi:hypothetical protein
MAARVTPRVEGPASPTQATAATLRVATPRAATLRAAPVSNRGSLTPQAPAATSRVLRDSTATRMQASPSRARAGDSRASPRTTPSSLLAMAATPSLLRLPYRDLSERAVILTKSSSPEHLASCLLLPRPRTRPPAAPRPPSTSLQRSLEASSTPSRPKLSSELRASYTPTSTD